MKILITSPSLDTNENISGISSVVENIILNNKKHQYFHFELGRKDIEKKNINWVFKQFTVLISFYLFIKKYKIDYVHLNVPFERLSIVRDYFLVILIKFHRKRILLHVHGGILLNNVKPNRIQYQVIKSIIKMSNTTLVLSKTEKHIIQKYSPQKTIYILPNAINVDRKLERKYGEKRIKILYLGRLDKNKGLYDILEALCIIRDKILFDLVLCGTGPEITIIKDFEKKLGNRFKYKGVVSGDEKENIINNSDIFLLPSYYEGLPMALLETMAAGLIPVITNVGSISSVVKHNYNGIIIKKNNPKNISEELERLYLDMNMRFKLAKNAKQTIIQRFNINKYIEELNVIYGKSLGN